MTTDAVSRSPTLPELLSLAIEYHTKDLWTALPGKIVKYDAETQKADVKPLVQDLTATEDGDELAEPLPVIPDVPVMFPRGGGFFVSFPVREGDYCMLVFQSRSIDKYLTGTGDDTDPGDFRTHDLVDAMAILGGAPFSKAIKEASAEDMIVGFDEGGLQLRITPDGKMAIEVGGDADEAVALANALASFWAIAKTAFDSHTHLSAVGPTAVPIPLFPAFDSSIISTKVTLKSG